jgi:hypothetical protein
VLLQHSVHSTHVIHTAVQLVPVMQQIKNVVCSTFCC